MSVEPLIGDVTVVVVPLTMVKRPVVVELVKFESLENVAVSA